MQYRFLGYCAIVVMSNLIAALMVFTMVAGRCDAVFQPNSRQQGVVSGVVSMPTPSPVFPTLATSLPAPSSLASHPSAVISADEQKAIQHAMGAMSFEQVHAFVRLWTLVSKVKLQMVYDAVINLNAKGIRGDVMEFGVWKGGATMTMMIAALHNGDVHNPRTFWLFDTFQGLPEPTLEDGERAANVWAKVASGQDRQQGLFNLSEGGKWNYGPKFVVKNNIRSTGYPATHIRFVEGKVEDTLPTTELPDKVAVLRLDTDWYASTKMELETMWDRLVSGGLLIIDDYCSWSGSTRATDEFFKLRGLSNILADAKSKLDERPEAIKQCIHIWKP
mmetsp:Transcript_99043/g.275729  ORF Transcript_99043/g.275729 Transcript_99043/m.275729 type:complete len:333 (+) Transcript_99043:101-1099(+)